MANRIANVLSNPLKKDIILSSTVQVDGKKVALSKFLKMHEEDNRNQGVQS